MAFQKGHTPPKKGEKMNKAVSTDDFEVGAPATRIMTDGSLASSVTVEPIDKPLNQDHLDEIAFMEELMEIMVQETTDENAENPVQVGVNGVFVQFFRGQPAITKRKFVDALIVKTMRVTTPEYTNNAGERSRAIRVQSALKFPFQVVSDRNPRGTEWLRRRMAEQV